MFFYVKNYLYVGNRLATNTAALQYQERKRSVHCHWNIHNWNRDILNSRHLWFQLWKWDTRFIFCCSSSLWLLQLNMCESFSVKKQRKLQLLHVQTFDREYFPFIRIHLSNINKFIWLGYNFDIVLCFVFKHWILYTFNSVLTSHEVIIYK